MSLVVVAVVGLVPSALARGAAAPATQTLTVAVETGGHVTSNPAGIDCSGGGTAGCQASFPSSSTVQLSASAVGLQLVANGNGSLKVSPAGVDKSGASAEAVCPPGSGLGGCWHYYPAGTRVSVEALPDPCVDGPNCFVGWSTADCPGKDECWLTLEEGDTTLVGTFSRLTLGLILQGTGRVTSDPAGIDCQVDAETAPKTCAAEFRAGQRVVLTAEGSPRSILWKFGCKRLDQDRSKCVKNVVEDFDWTGAIIDAPDDETFTRFGIGPITRIAFRTSHEGGGQVRGEGVECGGDCTETYDFGKELTFHAEPTSSDWQFDHWVGACSSDKDCTLNVGPTTALKAVFRPAGAGAPAPQSPVQPSSPPSQQPAPTPRPPAQQPRAPVTALTSRLLGVSVRAGRASRTVVVRLWVNGKCSARVRIARPQARRPMIQKQFVLGRGNNTLRLRLSPRTKTGIYVLRIAVSGSGAKRVTITRRITIRR